MRERTTVGELLGREIDIDVYDDVCEDLSIAFCGPVKLTEEGERRFSDILGCKVGIVDEGKYPYATVVLGGPGWNSRLKKAKELFESAAGFCSEAEYGALFEEV